MIPVGTLCYLVTSKSICHECRKLAGRVVTVIGHVMDYNKFEPPLPCPLSLDGLVDGAWDCCLIPINLPRESTDTDKSEPLNIACSLPGFSRETDHRLVDIGKRTR
jgi:hypothetical protein